MPYYVFDNVNNKYEGMTKEQILAAIVQAVTTHEISDVDTGFVTTLKEGNNGNALKMWVGTTAEYNAIQEKEPNCLYILSDDTELEDLEATITSMQTDIENNRNDINTINDDLDTIDGRLDGHDTDISTLQSGVNKINYKNGVVLYSGTWSPDSYGTALSGTVPISQFNAIKITIEGVEVICSVEHDTTNHKAIARGSYTYNRRSTQEEGWTAYIDTYSVYAEFDETHNMTLKNRSEKIEVYIPTNTTAITRTASLVNITKIVGIA